MSGRGRGAAAARLAAVALVLLALALRTFRLAEADIWWDEALAVWAVRPGLAAATRWTAGDVHPPLFFWCLGVWRGLVGESPFGLRMLVVFTGVVLAALAWPLGRRLAGPWGGALAVAAVATSRFLVWWSMELRMYALAAVACLVATLAAVRWLDRRRRRDLALYSVAAAAALLTVYVSAVALAALNAAVAAAWLVRPGRGRAAPAGVDRGAATLDRTIRDAAPAGRLPLGRRDVVAWAGAQAAALVLVVPWLVYASGSMSSWRVVEVGPSLAFAGQLWLTLAASGVSTDLDAVAPAVAAFAAALALAVAGAPRGVRGRAAPLLVALLVVPAVGIWAITQPRALFYSPRIEARYFAPFAAPLLATGAALAAGAAGRWRAAARSRRAVVAARLAAAGLAAALLGPSWWHLPGYYAPRRATDTLPAMALAIWSQAEPGDVVVLVSGNRYPMWLYHYDRAWDRPLGAPPFEYPADAPPRHADRPPVVAFPDRGSETLAGHPDWPDRLDGLVDDHDRVWLVEFGRDLQDPADEVEAWLGDRLALVLSEGYGPDALHLFARDDTPPRLTAFSTRWPGTTLLTGAATRTDGLPGRLPAARPARRAAPGDTLTATLFPLPGDPRTHGFPSPDALTVGACTLAVAMSPAEPPITGSATAADVPRIEWAMSHTSAVAEGPPPRRVRAAATIDAEAAPGAWRVAVDGCGRPWRPAWDVAVVRPAR